MDHLSELENQSIFILREAYKNFKNREFGEFTDIFPERRFIKKQK